MSVIGYQLQQIEREVARLKRELRLAADTRTKLDAASAAALALKADASDLLVTDGKADANASTLAAKADASALATTNANVASNTAAIAGKQATLDASNKQAVCIAMGVPWVQEHQAEGSNVGASSTAWHEVVSVTVPANSMGTNGRAVIDIMIEGVANTGQTAGRWLVDGTVVQSRQGGAWDNDANDRNMIGQASWIANNSTGSQRGHFFAHLTDEGGTDGVGGWLWQDGIGGSRFGDTSVDTRNDVVLSFEMKFTASDAANYFKRISAQLKIEPTAVVAEGG